MNRLAILRMSAKHGIIYERMNLMRKVINVRVAIFDFDGTLYEKDTFKILMSHLKHHPVYKDNYKPFFRGILPRYLGYKMKVYPEQRMKSQSMRLYLSAHHQLTKDQLMTYFGEVKEKMQAGFNPLVVAKLREHIQDNIHVMLVSGAFTLFIEEVITGLPFDTIIGTEIPFKGEAINYDKQLDHINGSRKNDKIHDALQGHKIDWSNSFAYGDSYSDLSVLDLVGHPVAVKPDSKLRAVAKKRGWEIM